MTANKERAIKASVWVNTALVLLTAYLVLMLAFIKADEAPNCPGFTDPDAPLWDLVPWISVLLSLLSVGFSIYVTWTLGRSVSSKELGKPTDAPPDH